MPKNEEVSLSSLGIQMPYNMQAEQSVLGAALMDETVLNRLITDMEPEMFYSDQNRALYRERGGRCHHAGQRPCQRRDLCQRR